MAELLKVAKEHDLDRVRLANSASDRGNRQRLKQIVRAFLVKKDILGE